MEKSLQELKDEAEGLGLDYKGMKSKAEVSALIESFYESQAAGDSVKEKTEDEVKEATPKHVTKSAKNMSALAHEHKKSAMEKRVVTITSNDKRDNNQTTTCYLSAENQFFGISRIVPLDIPVELEQCLIEVAKSVKIVLHMDDGNRTGNRVPKLVNKYVISYSE